MERRDIVRYTAANRTAWERIADARSRRRLSGAELAAGIANFDPGDLPTDDWRGLRVLHLMCASGEDSLTLALAGAKVTGVDISEANTTAARDKAQIAGLEAEFIAADVYDLPAMSGFDIVFTGGGALCWLPDIRLWARIVADALRRDGRLLVQEMHPLRGCFDVEGARLIGTGRTYFGRETPQQAGVGMGGVDMPGVAEFRWPIGDVVTALAQAGMRIDLLDEYFSPPADRAIPASTVEAHSLLPNDFLLAATKS
jgi:SAM-dependent methyltransferase